jgi:argininosuccinate lyase
MKETAKRLLFIDFEDFLYHKEQKKSIAYFQQLLKRGPITPMETNEIDDH